MISVIVITKNEEDRIMACLESVKWADEIIVVLNGPTDNTEKIVGKYTNKIIKVEGLDFAHVRTEGLNQVKGDWILYIDADERVLEPLKEEIKEITKNGDCSAYALSRRNIIFGTEVSYGPYKNDWMVRLFKKDKFKSWVGKVHEYGTFEGKLGYTKNSLLHLTHRDLDQIVLKSLSWSNIDAKLRIEASHPQISGWRLLRILFTELFNQGVRRRGFFWGTVGVMDALLQTFSLVMTYIRLWEMQQQKPLEEKYREIDKKLIEQDFRY